VVLIEPPPLESCVEKVCPGRIERTLHSDSGLSPVRLMVTL